MNRWVYLVLAANWLAACVDTVPKPYKGAGRDAGARDGGGLDATVLSSCRACIIGDGGACRAEYDTCLGVPKCKELIACGLETGCLVLPTLQERVQCATPCFKKVGIVDTADPGLTAGLNVNACSLGACASACGGM